MKIREGTLQKNVIARCERGEDLYGCLDNLVKANDIRSGCFQVIGAVSRARLGVFENGTYEWMIHEGALEISSCMGNVSVKEGESFVHCHAVLTDHRGIVIGGHVAEGCLVDPTAEIHMSVYAGELKRGLDNDSGLWTLDL
jgi:hypothetical protein